MHASDRRFRLHAFTVSCGHTRETDPAYDWNGLVRGDREFAVMQFTVAGRGALNYEGREYDLQPGQLMAVHIPHDHRYYLPTDSTEWEFVYVVVVGREMLRIVRRVELEVGPVIGVPDRSPLLESIYQILQYALSNEFRAHVPKPFELSDLTYHFGMKLLEQSLPYGPTNGSPAWIRQVQDRIQSQLSEHLEVADLAQRAGLSRSHFSREFTNHVGMSPQEYLKQERMKLAIQLLYNPKLSIKEIAYESGYADENYFCRVFRKVTGMSPGEYRKSGI